MIHCRAAPCHCQAGCRVQAAKCPLEGGRTAGLGTGWVLSRFRGIAEGQWLWFAPQRGKVPAGGVSVAKAGSLWVPGEGVATVQPWDMCLLCHPNSFHLRLSSHPGERKCNFALSPVGAAGPCGTAQSWASYDEPFRSSFQSASLRLRGAWGCHLHCGGNTETPPGAPRAGMENRPQRPLNLGSSQIRRSSSALKKKKK